MKRQIRADLAMTAAILLLGASLVFSGFSLLRLHWGTGATARTFGMEELLAVSCAGAGAALLGWWLLALACALLAPVAKALGAVKMAALSEQVSPAFMRRLVTAVVGMNLLTAPLAQAVGAPAIDPRWQGGTVQTTPATALPSPSPALPTQATGAATDRGDILPTAPPEPVAPQWVPHTAEIDPGALIRPSLRPGPAADTGISDGTGHAETSPASPAPVGADSDTGATASNFPADDTAGTDVVVKRGDSLWSIVAAALGPYSTDVDVAEAWPGWYRANRETIGADPNLILPGQVLHAP